MAPRGVNIWTSEYSKTSSKATNGKLKEVFRGRQEITKHIEKLESIIVHRISESGSFSINNIDKRTFYAWTDGIELCAKGRGKTFVLEEDEKICINPKYSLQLVVRNKNKDKGFVVEVYSRPFSEAIYNDNIGKIDHFPVLNSKDDIDEILKGELNQVTVHKFGAYDCGGNHCHTDGKIEMFGSVDKEVIILERIFENEKPGTLNDFRKKIKTHDITSDIFQEGQIFWFEPTRNGRYLSHATAAGPNGARFIELSSKAFNPENFREYIKPDIILSQDTDARRIQINAVLKLY